MGPKPVHPTLAPFRHSNEVSAHARVPAYSGCQVYESLGVWFSSWSGSVDITISIRILNVQRPHRRLHIVIHDMRINHRRREMRMAEGLLHQPDILRLAV